MNVEQIRIYCLNKKAVTESFPFNETTLVFKVGSKIFTLLNLDNDISINLKCEPDKAVELREFYEEVKPGYHMNKQHWNTIDLTGQLSDKLIFSWIDDSYNIVADSLSKKEKIQIGI